MTGTEQAAASNLAAVLPQHRFDTGALWRHLEAGLPGFAQPATLQQFTGGQSNPTFLITTPGHRYVLRKKPPGALLATAHMIEREYRVIHALRDSAVPVAPARLLCEDPAVIGTPFYVMDFVEGRLFTDPRLPEVPRSGRRALYEAMIGTLAELHCIDPAAVGLADFGKTGGYIARQLHRWSAQYRSTQTETIDAMERLMTWLPGHVPAEDLTAIAHGDFRLGNLIFDASAPRVRAVLDWELATLGHPLSDLAYCCMMHRLPVGTPHFDGLAGADLIGLGLPQEDELLEVYCRRTGRENLRCWSFYLAFALFRVAAIAQGVYRRGLQGNAADPGAMAFGEVARRTAGCGWAIAQGSRDAVSD